MRRKSKRDNTRPSRTCDHDTPIGPGENNYGEGYTPAEVPPLTQADLDFLKRLSDVQKEVADPYGTNSTKGPTL